MKVKVMIEIAENGYSAYMATRHPQYGLIGEGKTVDETIADFKSSYEEMKLVIETSGREFIPAEFEFCYDMASFLEEFSKTFTLAGLERITGINQKQLGHYLSGSSKPRKATVDRMRDGLRRFTEELSAVNFIGD